MNAAEIMSHQTAHSGRYVSLSDLILAEVAAKHSIPLKEWVGRWNAREARFKHPRQEAMYELRKRSKLSLPQIARKLGLKDHAAVIHGADEHARRNDLPLIRKPQRRAGIA